MLGSRGVEMVLSAGKNTPRKTIAILKRILGLHLILLDQAKIVILQILVV